MSKISTACDRLFVLFTEAVPLPAHWAQQHRKPSAAEMVRRAEQGLERFYAAAREERHHHRLGILGRARLAFALQRRLLAAGYEAALVKQVLFAMLVQAFVGK